MPCASLAKQEPSSLRQEHPPALENPYIPQDQVERTETSGVTEQVDERIGLKSTAEVRSACKITGQLPLWLTLSPHQNRFDSGAAFGATLYRNFVLFCAPRCDVDNRSIWLSLRLLFLSVRHRAGKFSIAEIGPKIRSGLDSLFSANLVSSCKAVREPAFILTWR